MEKLSKEREYTKKNQMENLELKNTITDEQISMDGLKSRMEKSEKDLVNLKIKQKLPILTERKYSGEERALRDLEKYSKDLTFVSSESQREKDRKSITTLNS